MPNNPRFAVEYTAKVFFDSDLEGVLQAAQEGAAVQIVVEKDDELDDWELNVKLGEVGQDLGVTYDEKLHQAAFAHLAAAVGGANAIRKWLQERAPNVQVSIVHPSVPEGTGAVVVVDEVSDTSEVALSRQPGAHH